MSFPTTVLVTGATGLVGSSVLASLPANARGVGLVRSGRPPSTPLGGVDYRAVDAWSYDALSRALEGVNDVVHCASVVHHPHATEAEYARFNVDGTRVLVQAATRAGVRSVVFVSTIKVYGEDPMCDVLDEASPVVRDTPYARTKLDAERIVLDAAASRGPRGVVLRLCPVFGRGDKSNVRAMIRAIARRRFVVPGAGQNRKSIVHISSVCEVTRAALESTQSGVFVVADTDAPTMRELSDTIADVLGVKRPLSAPEPLLQAVAAALELGCRVARRPSPVTRHQMRKLVQRTVCSPARARAELGAACHVELAPALADEVTWLRESALL